jgi:hypothetical protein
VFGTACRLSRHTPPVKTTHSSVEVANVKHVDHEMVTMRRSPGNSANATSRDLALAMDRMIRLNVTCEDIEYKQSLILTIL